MKIKIDNIEFSTFNDGVCNIFTTDEEEKRLPSKYINLGFEDRILGFKRFFEGNARNININRVIRIPQLGNIDNEDYVEIEGVPYGIKIVQPIYGTNPPSIDLTLDKANI
ncbi:hypothetical protein [Clostridium estertheticum]|uniref:hypothetical protein n=1 Tax=Clostridium estertheticum TaxID=238834 RepID=UPI001C6E576E|nr:hypothetical protein [Clostridium estertheticum]MBW9154289.1 hypothetical protein [Clostridium estertheticum]WLC86664.1 hypothetical protein KTC97_22095 [Clostridium estertheticum]